MHPNNLDWKTYWLLEHLTQFHTITVKIQTHFQDKRVILKNIPFHTNIKETPSQWQILKTFTQSYTRFLKLWLICKLKYIIIVWTDTKWKKEN